MCDEGTERPLKVSLQAANWLMLFDWFQTGPETEIQLGRMIM